MRLEERYDKVLAWFRERMPLADTELQYNDPFQLLVAVILSAQCTDKRVNMVTPALFEQFPDAESMSKASVEEIFELIKSISYPNNKSKHLSAMISSYCRRCPGWDGKRPMSWKRWLSSVRPCLSTHTFSGLPIVSGW